MHNLKQATYYYVPGIHRGQVDTEVRYTQRSLDLYSDT
jgi:hypothetical protein